MGNGLIRGEDTAVSEPIGDAATLPNNQPQMREYTLCVVINGDNLLLKFANRGVSKGKWNFPGGKIEDGETAPGNITREVLEETGLKVANLFYHGKKDCYYRDYPFFDRVHVFSTESFDGALKASDEEGIVAWVGKESLPLDSMWKDVRVWLDQALTHHRFDAKIDYSNPKGDVMEKAHLELKGTVKSA